MDPRIKGLADIPYTISFIIRKRQQIDSFNELPKEKRPPEYIIWDGTSEEIDDWLDKVFDSKTGGNKIELAIKPSDVEG